MYRRDYLKGLGALGTTAATGCLGPPTETVAKPLPEGFDEIVDATNQRQQAFVDWLYEREGRFLGIDTDNIRTELVPLDYSEDSYRLETYALAEGPMADLSEVEGSDDISELNEETVMAAVHIGLLNMAAVETYVGKFADVDYETHRLYEDAVKEMTFVIDGAEAGGAYARYGEHDLQEIADVAVLEAVGWDDVDAVMYGKAFELVEAYHG